MLFRSKASTQQLADAIATREPTIAENSLSQSKVQNLASTLLGKASTQQLADAIATREPTIGEGSLSQSKVQNLTSALADKASTQQLADAIAGRQATLTAQSNIVVDTIQSRLYLGDTFRFWKADQSTARC